MQSKQRSRAEEQLETAARAAPGAIAPTGGAVPEDAPGRRSKERHDVDELIDALGLLLRAARDLDPARSDTRLRALEHRSERTIAALQELEYQSLDARDDSVRSARVAELALATRTELADAVDRALSGIHASLLAHD